MLTFILLGFFLGAAIRSASALHTLWRRLPRSNDDFGGFWP